MKITNTSEIALTPIRRDALAIVEAGLAAIDTKQAIHAAVRIENDTLFVGDRVIPLASAGRIIVSGVGKCALEAAQELEAILGDRGEGGVVLYLGEDGVLQKGTAIRGTHPMPSDGNVEGARELVASLKNLSQTDIVLFVVSGGGSTLLCLPENKGCEEEGRIFEALTRAGATIQELNTVRKHLSLARGGFIAKHAYPATVIGLIFSDVPGDNLQFIASGPTVKDTTTVADAEAILAKYDVLRICSIEQCGLVETPKEDMYFERVTNHLVVSSEIALAAMEKKAEELKYDAVVKTTTLTGEAQAVAKMIGDELHAAPAKIVLLYAGETTVSMEQQGRGGRNLEVVAGGLSEIRDNELVISFATDGRDNGAFSGAICDIITRDAAVAKGLDVAAALEAHNTYPFFEQTGHYLVTGSTGSNVSDIILAVKQ